MSHEDFVNNLNIKVVSNLLTENKGLAFSRCADLLSKTNQFNTASKHLNISEFSSFVEKNTVVYFSVSDKLQDYGIVGVILLESSTNTIVQYVMSCRVLGMDVEYKVLDQLFDILKTNNLKAILNKTDKNKPCHNLYLKGNFTYAEGVWIKGNKLTT